MKLRTALQDALRRLPGDPAGATLPMGAAALLVLLVLVGSGIDISRGYMVQTGLQAACDSAVLAGRRAMSKSNAYGLAERAKADRMFAFNFPAEQFAARDTSFISEANDDGEVTGAARATLPTVVMYLFGFGQFDLSAACSAELQLASADIMFVLDTTGSMNCNPGDDCNSSSEATNAKIKRLREAVREFHRTVAAAVQDKEETRIRYAFVPYSMTVNVKNLLLEGLLPSDYIADRVNYQSRRALFSSTPNYLATSGAPATTVETYSSAITQAQCNSFGVNSYPTSGANPVVSGTAPANVTTTTYSVNSWTRTTGSGTTARGTCKRNRTAVVTTYVTRYSWSGSWRYVQTPLDTSAFKSFSTVPLVTGIASSGAYAPSSGYFDVQALAG